MSSLKYRWLHTEIFIDICIHIHTGLISTPVLLFQLTATRSTSHIQILVSNIILQWREPEEIAESMTEAGNIQDEPEASSSVRKKKRSAQKQKKRPPIYCS